VGDCLHLFTSQRNRAQINFLRSGGWQVKRLLISNFPSGIGEDDNGFVPVRTKSVHYTHFSELTVILSHRCNGWSR